MQLRRTCRRACLLLLAAGQAGCASYGPLPLPRHARLASSLAELDLASVPIHGSLRVADVAVLALRNNPELAAARTQHAVAAGVRLQSRLLSNPSVTGSILPLAAGLGDVTAFNAGISYDVRSLVTLSARRRAATAQAQSVDAAILWREWQVVAQARLLSVDIMAGERSLALQRQTRALLDDRARTAGTALAQGNVTLAVAAPDLAAAQIARTTVDNLERVQLGRRHQLAALLGLSPEVELALAPTPDLPRIDPDAVRRLLPGLAGHRPDLVALQLGYRAQDEAVRAAILAQFPNVVFGVTGGSDNANVRNIGPQVSLDLPVFDHAQGQIAFARATRRQLHDEYSARLTAAVGEVEAMLGEIALQQVQLDRMRADVAQARDVAGKAQSALAAGNLDARSALDLISTRVSREAEIVDLEQSVSEQQVAILTLIGAGMPAMLDLRGDVPDAAVSGTGPPDNAALLAVRQGRGQRA